MYLIEEFFYASLEIKNLDWARTYMQIVSNKHPQSVKQMRMLALFSEATHDLDKAREIYNELITINASDF